MTGRATFHEPVVRRHGDAFVWWRSHCGSCDWCTRGLESWCIRRTWPSDSGERWSEPFRTFAPDCSARAVAAAAIVLDVLDGWAEGARTVLVVGVGEDSHHVVTMLEHCGIQAVAEPHVAGRHLSATTRGELGVLSESGRADLAVTFTGELAICARWVRRSGAVATTLASAPEPDLDALTMRELTVLSPRRAHAWIPRVATS